MFGGPPGGTAARPAVKDSSYLFGGDYWVMLQKGEQAVPMAVKTGLTDLEFSEVVAGLSPGDRVLLWGHYLIPQWYLDTEPVVYWNKFGRPDTAPERRL